MKKITLAALIAAFAAPVFAGGNVNSLVETKWLADNLSNTKVVFVDNWPSDKEEDMKKHVK